MPLILELYYVDLSVIETTQYVNNWNHLQSLLDHFKQQANLGYVKWVLHHSTYSGEFACYGYVDYKANSLREPILHLLSDN